MCQNKQIIEGFEMLELKSRLYRLFTDMGISPACRGYYYLAEAVIFMLTDSKRRMGDIYSLISDKEGVSYSSTERAMRYAISHVYSEWADKGIVSRILSGDRKISNSIFVYEVCGHIKYERNAFIAETEPKQ